jgi:hypothetical protein
MAGGAGLQFGDLVSLDVGVIYIGFIGIPPRRLRWAAVLAQS